MTEQENINNAVQMQIAAQNARIDTVMAKVDALINEANQQRQDIRELNKKVDDKIDALDKKINDNQKEFMQQLHNNFVQTLIGVGAIMVTVGGLIIAVLK